MAPQLIDFKVVIRGKPISLDRIKRHHAQFQLFQSLLPGVTAGANIRELFSLSSGRSTINCVLEICRLAVLFKVMMNATIITDEK